MQCSDEKPTLGSRLSTLDSLPPNTGVEEIIVQSPGLRAHREVNIGQILLEAQTACAVTNIRPSPASTGVVCVVRPLMLIHVFMRHERLVSDPGVPHIRRHWPRANVHLC